MAKVENICSCYPLALKEKKKDKFPVGIGLMTYGNYTIRLKYP